jgi:hypothetical protein
VALIVRIVPAFCHDVPTTGVVVPLPGGETTIVNWYCVCHEIDSVIGAFIVTENGLLEPV